jgi:hypothetical protein
MPPEGKFVLIALLIVRIRIGYSRPFHKHS